MDQGFELDLLASSLRAESRDLDAFTQALAVRLSNAFPGRVAVRTTRLGAFRIGRRRVCGLVLSLSNRRFVLRRESDRIITRLESIVCDVAVSRREVSVEEWIDELCREVSVEAERSSGGREALERLLR